MFLILNPPPVTIDEVQRAKELFRYIKIKCDESKERGLFCLSGSQPFHLMQNVSESLSGRIGILELSGLSMRESMKDAFNRHFLPTPEYVTERRKSLQKPDNIWEIIHRGGYPELQDTQKEWSAFYADYVRTYMERDVRELAAVQDLSVFRQFMIAAAARTGEILNYSTIATFPILRQNAGYQRYGIMRLAAYQQYNTLLYALYKPVKRRLPLRRPLVHSGVLQYFHEHQADLDRKSTRLNSSHMA